MLKSGISHWQNFNPILISLLLLFAYIENIESQLGQCKFKWKFLFKKNCKTGTKRNDLSPAPEVINILEIIYSNSVKNRL